LKNTTSNFLLLHDIDFRCTIGIFIQILNFVYLIIKILFVISTGFDNAGYKTNSLDHDDLNRRIEDGSSIPTLHNNIKHCHDNEASSRHNVSKGKEIEWFEY
jgi:hypothetical protein